MPTQPSESALLEPEIQFPGVNENKHLPALTGHQAPLRCPQQPHVLETGHPRVTDGEVGSERGRGLLESRSCLRSRGLWIQVPA